MKKTPEPQRSETPKRTVVSPYHFRLQPKAVSPGLGPGIEPPLPVELSPPEKTPSHRHLGRWGLAAGGLLAVAYAPQAQGTPAVPPAEAAPARTPSALAPIPQEHVTAAVHHAVSAYAPHAEGAPAPTVMVVNVPSGPTELAVHIRQEINAESDHTIDIVVQQQKQPPTEAEKEEAKKTFRWIVAGAVLDKLGEKVFDKVLEKGIDKGIDLAWRELKKRTKRLREANASRPNPILGWMAEASATLEQIFGPPDAEPKTLSIDFIATNLDCSWEQAEAILQQGPFVESSPGLWRLDPEF